jgi:hypothetical protein
MKRFLKIGNTNMDLTIQKIKDMEQGGRKWCLVACDLRSSKMQASNFSVIETLSIDGFISSLKDMLENKSDSAKLLCGCSDEHGQLTLTIDRAPHDYVAELRLGIVGANTDDWYGVTVNFSMDSGQIGNISSQLENL